MFTVFNQKKRKEEGKKKKKKKIQRIPRIGDPNILYLSPHL